MSAKRRPDSNKLLMHGTNRFQILLDHRVERPPTVADVTPQPSNETNIGVGIHKDLQIEQATQP